MRIWYDTEFLETSRTIDLISIGMVREDGAEYYAVSNEAARRPLCGQIRKHEWLMANVVPAPQTGLGKAREAVRRARGGDAPVQVRGFA